MADHYVRFLPALGNTVEVMFHDSFVGVIPYQRSCCPRDLPDLNCITLQTTLIHLKTSKITTPSFTGQGNLYIYTRAVSRFTIFCLYRYRVNDMIIENRYHLLTIHTNDSQMPISACISKVLVLSGHLWPICLPSFGTQLGYFKGNHRVVKLC